MINKTNFIVIMFLMLLSASAYCADPKNFVFLSNGASFAKSASTIHNSSFLGQTLVSNSVSGRDLISQSGFSSSISKVQNSSITFVNLTEDKEYTTHVVPVQVRINTTEGTISKVRYKISQGDSGIWEPEKEYALSGSSSTVIFTENVAFAECKTSNYIQIYAQNSSNITGSWSPSYTIRLSSSVEPGDVKFISPDPLTNLSSLDPLIQTTEFSIAQSSVTITLYQGLTEVYSVSASSTSDVYSIFDSTNSRISYLNSDILNSAANQTSLKSLAANKEYRLTVDFSDVYDDFSITFTALGGGVADILTYPSPFNPNREKIKIRYILSGDSRVTIKLYDKAGKIVKKLENPSGNAGTNEIEWDGKNYAGETLATGVYICEIIANSSDGKHRRYTALAIVGR